MIKDYSKKSQWAHKTNGELETKILETMMAFDDLHKARIVVVTLFTKTKELISLGIVIPVRCDGCIALHVNDALKSGASSEEILKTIGVAILMGGGPAVVYGCEAMEPLSQFIVLEN